MSISSTLAPFEPRDYRVVFVIQQNGRNCCEFLPFLVLLIGLEPIRILLRGILRLLQGTITTINCI